METRVLRDKDGLLTVASGNFLPIEECYEVEIIRNDEKYHDTKYRIEMIDNSYIDVTTSELYVLKHLLNDKEVSKLLGLEE